MGLDLFVQRVADSLEHKETRALPFKLMKVKTMRSEYVKRIEEKPENDE